MKKYIFPFILIFGIIFDLTSKKLSPLYLQEKITVFGDFIYLQYVENDGIAFSVNIPFLKVLTIILIIALFVYYLREEKKKHSLLVDTAFGLILAGAIGNGIERIFQGYVIDFIGVEGFSVFNIADSCISIGAIIYLYYIFLQQKDDSMTKREKHPRHTD